jgi:hypothetical protein
MSISPLHSSLLNLSDGATHRMVRQMGARPLSGAAAATIGSATQMAVPLCLNVRMYKAARGLHGIKSCSCEVGLSCLAVFELLKELDNGAPSYCPKGQ